MAISPQAQRLLLDLASDAMICALGGSPHTIPLPEDSIFSQSAGCFVSLHRNGTHALRGCVGLLESNKPLSETIVAAARSTLRDPRFTNDPVCLHELTELNIELTLIHPMRQVSSPLDFDPMEHGIYLTIFERNGCFLPQVARETGWTRQQLLSRLCTEKLGVHADAWKDPAVILKVFTVDVIGPAEIKC